MKIRFFRAIARGISLAAALVPGVFAMAQNAEASERAGPFGCAQDEQAPPLQKPGGAAEEGNLVGTWRGESLCVEKGDGDVKSPLHRDKDQRDFSLRRPTGSQEQTGKKSVGLLDSERRGGLAHGAGTS